MADTPTSAPGVQGESGEGVLSPGRVFAGHEILREAGRGGMGVVYEARHVRLQVVRALKVLTERSADDAVFRARFERECQLAASLEHPNVVPVYEAGESDGALYLSMRFVDGPNLGQVLADDGPLDPDRAAGLIAQVAAGLDAAHDAGLVHRDVKPANILLEERSDGEQAFLGDFGISRMLAPGGRLTETGEMLGTVDYVAPEQIAGTSVDARSDVYSLACVAFEGLTGRPPFRRETRLATMFAHANAPRPDATGLRADLPRAVDAVFARALAIDPRRRYARASEFAADLQEALAGRRTHRPPLRPSARWLVIAAAIVAVLGITAAVLVFAGTFDSGGDGRSGAESPRPLAAPPARVSGDVRIADPPSALAVGQLNLWTASSGAGSISAVVPVDSDRARPPISVPGTPASVIPGFGSIWVVDRAHDALLRVDPKRGAPTRIPVGHDPSDVAVSANHLWVTNRGDDTVSRIDPATNRVDETRRVGSSPSAVAVGEGGVWVADSGNGTVTELDPVSGRPRGKSVPVGGAPSGIAAGEGGVWVVDADGRLVRISPGSREVTPVTTGPAHATAVTTGFGYAWIASGDGTVERIDPALLRPAGEPIDVGGSPTAIAAGDGFVWAGGRQDPELTRIDPRGNR